MTYFPIKNATCLAALLFSAAPLPLLSQSTTIDPPQNSQKPSFQSPFPESSPLHKPFLKFMLELQKDDSFIKAVTKTKSSDEARQMGSKLTAQGLLLLPENELEQNFVIKTEIFRHIDIYSLAAIFKDDAESAKKKAGLNQAIMNALEKLDQKSIESWFDAALKGARLALTGKKPINPTEKEIEKAWEYYFSTVSKTEIDDIAMIWNAPNDASETDLYWAVQKLFLEIPRMPNQHKFVFIRAFLAN